MRTPDTRRVLDFLYDGNAAQTATNKRVRDHFGWSREKWDGIKKELIDGLMIGPYQCRGGGVGLTDSGKRECTNTRPVSNVGKEKDLYAPFMKRLKSDVENDVKSGATWDVGVPVILDTSAHRRRTEWSNPDVTKISVRSYPNLRKHAVVHVATYELKQWGAWGVSSVYEAVSHGRFAHESNLVIEWAKDREYDAAEASELVPVCERFGIGLIVFARAKDPERPENPETWTCEPQVKARINAPPDELVEEFLDEVFQRDELAKADLDKLCAAAADKADT